jgi:hypothetical protein
MMTTMMITNNKKGVMLMIRGTTAQFKFKLPYTKENVESIEVVWWQHGHSGINRDFPLPIAKQYKRTFDADGAIVTSGPWNWLDDRTIGVKLWQQETITFSDKRKAYVQMRGKSVDGHVFASDQELVTVYPIYGDYVFGDEIIPAPNEDGMTVFDGGDITQK